MVRHTLKILQQMLQDFESMCDHFGLLCGKVLKFLPLQYLVDYKILRNTHGLIASEI